MGMGDRGVESFQKLPKVLSLMERLVEPKYLLGEVLGVDVAHVFDVADVAVLVAVDDFAAPAVAVAVDTAFADVLEPVMVVDVDTVVAVELVVVAVENVVVVAELVVVVAELVVFVAEMVAASVALAAYCLEESDHFPEKTVLRIASVLGIWVD